MSISIRLLAQTDYLKIIELAPDDDIMSSILFSIAKDGKDCSDKISYTYGAFIDDELIPRHDIDDINKKWCETCANKEKCGVS